MCQVPSSVISKSNAIIQITIIKIKTKSSAMFFSVCLYDLNDVWFRFPMWSFDYDSNQILFIQRAMELLKECPLLKIEDILPFFPDFVTIDHFKVSSCLFVSIIYPTLKARVLDPGYKAGERLYKWEPR